MQGGMIGYVVPHKLYPAGYHCKPEEPLPFAGLASQKNYMSLYLMTVYFSPTLLAWLKEQFALKGKNSTWASAASASRNSKTFPWTSSAKPSLASPSPNTSAITKLA